jgi:hypothetical protein
MGIIRLIIEINLQCNYHMVTVQKGEPITFWIQIIYGCNGLLLNSSAYSNNIL